MTVPDRASLRSLQAVAALWLIVSPFVLTGPQTLVAVKDVVLGALLLLMTIVARRDHRVRRLEGPLCLFLGLALIGASIAVEFGSGSAAAARQWNEVVVGVLLVYLSASRVR